MMRTSAVRSDREDSIDDRPCRRTRSMRVRKRERDRRAQYRFVADHAIEACRLQHTRTIGGDSAPRHDLDFYLVDVEVAQPAAERLYAVPTSVLGELERPGG
jgi:hypothetical protein